MVKVLEEKEVPRDTIECSNCGSLLEYGNADLYEDYRKNETSNWIYNEVKTHYFNCPVCGCKISASWISKKKKVTI